MTSRLSKKSELPQAPLYNDLLEFIELMGIKQSRVIDAFGLGRSNWYKLKQRHLNGLTLEHMHNFAVYFNLPTEKVISLCYATYLRGLAQQVGTTQSTLDQHDIDLDFPPIS